MHGRVKFYNAIKGYGFIECPDIEDVFFHINAVVRNGVPVTVGARVTFEVSQGRRGRLAAQSIMVLSE